MLGAPYQAHVGKRSRMEQTNTEASSRRALQIQARREDNTASRRNRWMFD